MTPLPPSWGCEGNPWGLSRPELSVIYPPALVVLSCGCGSRRVSRMRLLVTVTSGDEKPMWLLTDAPQEGRCGEHASLQPITHPSPGPGSRLRADSCLGTLPGSGSGGRKDSEVEVAERCGAAALPRLGCVTRIKLQPATSVCPVRCDLPLCVPFVVHRCGVRPSISSRSCPRGPSPVCVPSARTARCVPGVVAALRAQGTTGHDLPASPHVQTPSTRPHVHTRRHALSMTDPATSTRSTRSTGGRPPVLLWSLSHCEASSAVSLHSFSKAVRHAQSREAGTASASVRTRNCVCSTHKQAHHAYPVQEEWKRAAVTRTCSAGTRVLVA